MSVTTRQNKLLVAEDWKKVYQSFKNADFQSYDFENLRRTMIDYIRINYPEDFNDYIESSEYLALIDLIAFLGQSIAFRVDLNARDNFLELAERREAVLRLARTISYNAKRNIPATGLLKINTVSTTENVIDSNGRNLSGQVITWNDPSNANWYDQFIKVLNASFPRSQQFGNPADSATIYSIPTEQYRFESNITGVPVFSFSKAVAGRTMNFEITSTTFKDQNYIYEEAPKLGNKIACVYRDDGKGLGSSRSGFFFHFVQGSLQQGAFVVTQPSSNESVDINANNINNSDVWLYRLDSDNNEDELWTQVSSLEGNNIIYNSLKKNIRNIYSVISKTGDTVSLQFGDGKFGNLPLGTFKTYYRISNGLEFTIRPQDIRSVSVILPYTSATGQAETLSITLSLTVSSSNATAAESNDNIKAVAPANFYTQNRTITGEDYNISPLTASPQVARVKALNRTASGISRYFDLVDPTGKYSSTTLFADDGILYTEKFLSNLRFSYTTRTDIEGVIYNNVYEILKKESLRNFYYSNYIDYINTALDIVWNNVTSDTTTSSGCIKDVTGSIIYRVGSAYTTTNLKYIRPGCLVKFVAPTGYYFDKNNLNKLVSGYATTPGAAESIWAKIVSVVDDGTATGTGVLSTGFGPIVLNDTVPTGAIITQIMPAWRTSLSSSVITTMIDLIFSNRPFGLRYDASSQVWNIVLESNLNLSSSFSLVRQGDTSNQQLDASWMLLFTTDNEYYTITSREQRYIFESDKQVQFYCDRSNKIYDSRTNKIVKDTISVLSVNNRPDNIMPFNYDQTWDVVSEFYGLDGYIDSKKMIVSFADSDSDGNVDNPELFLHVVGSIGATSITGKVPTGLTSQTVATISTGIKTFFTNIAWTSASAIAGSRIRISYQLSPSTFIEGIIISFIENRLIVSIDATNGFGSFNSWNISNVLETYIIEEKYSISSSQEDYRYVSNSDNKVLVFDSENVIGLLSQYTVGQYFYFSDVSVVKKLVSSPLRLEASLDYKAYVGRDKIKFQYNHSADYESRIDPGASNIIDLFVLTKEYDTTFRQWLAGADISKPLPPGSDELYDMISPTLNLTKSWSDEVIYHPVNYKILFGTNAEDSLQATFKVVKNTNRVVSDNDIKARVIASIEQFFELENWDFGDTFYFTELSAYVMKELAPDIANFVIVPQHGSLNFGNLFEIKSASDEMFVSGATVDDVEIVAALTPTLLKAIPGSTQESTIFSKQQITSSTYGASNG